MMQFIKSAVAAKLARDSSDSAEKEECPVKDFVP
jgi:hypothetical protein